MPKYRDNAHDVIKDMRERGETMTRGQYAELKGLSYSFVAFYAIKYKINFVILERFKAPTPKYRDYTPMEVLKFHAESIVNKTDASYIILVPTDGRKFYNVYKREVMISDRFREMFINHLKEAESRYVSIDRTIISNLIEDIEDDVETYKIKESMDTKPIIKVPYQENRGKSKRLLREIVENLTIGEGSIKDSKRSMLKFALIKENYNIENTAKRLGVSYRTVTNWVAELRREHKLKQSISICGMDHIRF